MNRSALIIGSPDAKIPGVRQDMVNYRRFLESPLGGMWRSSEVETLESPSKTVVQQKLELLKSADYSFVVFAGHGRHLISTKSTIVTLQSGIEMDADDLKIGAPKRTLVLDCCRVLSARPMLESLMAKAASFAESLNSVDCRRYFDQRLSECENGLVTLHACGVGETADETSDEGGLYSSSLMGGASAWRGDQSFDATKHYRILSIIDAHNLAAERVKRSSGQSQNPTATYPRVTKHFPFAIVA